MFITTNKDGIAIMSTGATEAEAIAAAIRDAGPLHRVDADTDQLVEMTEAEMRDEFPVYPATPALIAKVQEEGGAITWGTLPDGTVCTDAEESQ